MARSGGYWDSGEDAAPPIQKTDMGRTPRLVHMVRIVPREIVRVLESLTVLAVRALLHLIPATDAATPWCCRAWRRRGETIDAVFKVQGNKASYKLNARLVMAVTTAIPG